MTSLEVLRAEIDSVDREILSLLETRARIAGKVQRVKAEVGMPLYSPARKAAHIAALADAAKAPLTRRVVEEVFSTVHDETLGLMREKRPTESPLATLSRRFKLGDVEVGGDAFWIAGPCAVETEDQMVLVAAELARRGVRVLRGGAFKPRTRPGSFQGLGRPGLEILRRVADVHGMMVVTEALDVSSLEQVAELADVVQIGTRNALNYSLLSAAGGVGKPVLLKRGFGATVSEWLAAAEYLAVAGCDQVILCERGIRTFEPSTRATVDVAAVPVVAALTGLPVVVDVSHAAGRRDLVGPLAKAAFAIGAAGVMVEVHPSPSAALSDGAQQLTTSEFAALAADAAASVSRAPRPYQGTPSAGRP